MVRALAQRREDERPAPTYVATAQVGQMQAQARLFDLNDVREQCLLNRKRDDNKSAARSSRTTGCLRVSAS